MHTYALLHHRYTHTPYIHHTCTMHARNYQYTPTHTSNTAEDANSVVASHTDTNMSSCCLMCFCLYVSLFDRCGRWRHFVDEDGGSHLVLVSIDVLRSLEVDYVIDDDDCIIIWYTNWPESIIVVLYGLSVIWITCCYDMCFNRCWIAY